MDRLPIWNASHALLTVAELFTKLSELRMGVAAPMRIMKGHVEKKVLENEKST